MTGHWDAAWFGGALFVAFFLTVLILSTAHHRRLRAHRADYRAKLAAERERHQHATERDRKAYWKLHGTLVALAGGVPIEDAVLQARLAPRDEPIPYAVAEGYAPTWTQGAAPEGVEAEFTEIVRDLRGERP